MIGVIDVLKAQKKWVSELLESENFYKKREDQKLKTELWVNQNDDRYRVFVDYDEQTASFVFPLTEWFVREHFRELESFQGQLDDILYVDYDEPIEAGQFLLALTEEVEEFFPEEAGGVGTSFAYVGIEVTAPLQGWYFELFLTVKVEELVYLFAKELGLPVERVQELAENIQSVWYQLTRGDEE